VASSSIPLIDRASHLRKNTERLMKALDAPSTLLVPVWRDKSLVDAAPRAALPTVAEASTLIDRSSELVWLGLLGGVDCFALELSELEAPLADTRFETGAEFVDLRAVGSLLALPEAGLLAYARGMLRWHRHHRYCGLCGGRTRAREGGHLRECEADGEKHFPRTDPAVMVLVEQGDRCVLGRQPGWPAGMYSVVAGFVEPGESLEEAALREVREEVGLEVEEIRYFRSQPWPFPASLMVGFRARSSGQELCVDREELEEARWFSRQELEHPQGFFYPPPFSLAHHLITAFLGGPH
jgi:NAD+ diphosphatase